MSKLGPSGNSKKMKAVRGRHAKANFERSLQGESSPVTTRIMTPEEYYERFGVEMPEHLRNKS